MFKNVLIILILLMCVGLFPNGAVNEQWDSDSIMILKIKIENNIPAVQSVTVKPGYMKNGCRDFSLPADNGLPSLYLYDSMGNMIYMTAFGYPLARTVPPRLNPADDSHAPDMLQITDPEIYLLVPYMRDVKTIEIYNPGESLPQYTAELDSLDVRFEKGLDSFIPTRQRKAVDGEKFHLLIIASGFTAADMNTFTSKAEEFKNYLLAVEPFLTGAPLMEVHIYENLEDLGCATGCYNIDRLLCCDSGKVISAAVNSGYLFDEIIVMHKTLTYSGGGFTEYMDAYRTNSYTSYAMVYSGTYFKEVALHEFGHSFGNLCDEYTYTTEGSSYSLCVNCRENCSDWSHITDACQLSCSAMNDYYRPEDSIMLSLSIPYFNRVSIFSTYMPHGLERRLRFFTGQEVQVYLQLQVERQEEHAWIIRKEFAAVQLTVDNPGDIAVAKFVVYRQEGNGFQAIKEILPSELQGGSFSFTDEDLGKNMTYIYKVEAQDTEGKIVGISNLVTI